MFYPVLYANFEKAYCDNDISNPLDWYTKKIKRACVTDIQYKKSATEELKVAEENNCSNT